MHRGSPPIRTKPKLRQGCVRVLCGVILSCLLLVVALRTLHILGPDTDTTPLPDYRSNHNNNDSVSNNHNTNNHNSHHGSSHTSSTPDNQDRLEATAPYLLRPDRRSGGHVRVLVAVMSNRINHYACVAVGSAFLSGIPVVVVGYDEVYSHTVKWKLMLDGARRAGLQPNDVIVYVDADVMFADGPGLVASIDRFIAESAPSADKLDPRAVREGRVRAPMIITRETFCFAPQTFGSVSNCNSLRNKLAAQYKSYAEPRNISLYVKTPSSINSGTFIARVWAFTEAAASFDRFLALNPKPAYRGRWKCDQSVIQALYRDLRVWEIEKDMLTASASSLAALRSTYGLRAGLMEADERNELSIVSTARRVYLSNELWGGGPDHIQKPLSHAGTEVFVERAYRGYAGDLSPVPLPVLGRNGSYTTAPNEAYLMVVPPMVIVNKAGNVLLSDVPDRSAIPIVHIAGGKLPHMRPALMAYSKKSLEAKLSKIAYHIHHMPWYVPMRGDAQRIAEATAYLSKLRFAVLSQRVHDTLSYKEVCMDAFAPREPIDPAVYALTAELYQLFFDYKQAIQ